MTEESRKKKALSFSISREIRVFVSSTFRDMQRERELLVKQVFPELRRVCARRFVTFTEVDLRWGITEEQAAEGKILPICLEEINLSRPYFIGMLGERYGWIPQDIQHSILAKEPWLKDYVCNHTSVTELEILHGVLNNPEMADHAYFYFRDPKYINTLSNLERHNMIEHDIPDDVSEFGKTIAMCRTEGRKTKLASLKNRIRQSGLPLVENYPNPEAFADIVRKQFLALIDQLYPEDSTPDPLVKETLSHDCYAAHKLLAYVNRPDQTAVLDAFVLNGSFEQGLVITGESGSGKTCLLADWIQQWRKNNKDDFVFVHYFGSTPNSASIPHFLRRLLFELKRRFSFPYNIPSQIDDLSRALHHWLPETVGKGRIILVLDAINQIEGEEPDRRLIWLPQQFSSNVRILASALSGTALNVLNERKWKKYTLPLPNTIERSQMIDKFFQHYRKQPGDKLRNQLINASGSSNPLFLRTVLEELRQIGSFEHLPDKVVEYLSASTLEDLFRLVIHRWLQDFNTDSNIVPRTLCLLWVARHGLSEMEWRELLGTTDEPLLRNLWSPLFLAMEPHLILRADLYTFAHDFLRRAVQAEYLAKEEVKKTFHSILADYFSKNLPQILSKKNCLLDEFNEHNLITYRILHEVPWQLRASVRWQLLLDFLSSIPIFYIVCKNNMQFEWMEYWQQIMYERKTDMSSVDIQGIYLQNFRLLSSKDKILVAGTLGQFLTDLGYYETAQELFREEAENDLFKSDNLLLAMNLNDKGLIEKGKGNFINALKYFDEAMALLDKNNYPPDKDIRQPLASILMNKENMMRELGDKTKSRALLERSLHLMQETTGERSPETATVMQSFGNFLLSIEDFEGAKHWHCQALNIRREQLGPAHRDVAISLYNLANVFISLENYYFGIQLLERASEIMKQYVDSSHKYCVSITESLEKCKQVENHSMKRSSGFGVVLLVFNSQPLKENPPDPGTSEGVHAIAEKIVDNLIEIFDNTIAKGNYIPVVVYLFPGFHSVVSIVQEHPILKRYPSDYLNWIEIPKGSKSVADHQHLFQLLSIRNQFLNWINSNKFDVIMIKPLGNVGATIDHVLLNSIRHNSPDDKKDCLPLTIEVVEYDNLDGPILGLYTGNEKPRPSILPTLSFRKQGYSPQREDKRATGTFYINIPAIKNFPDNNIGLLNNWSALQLISIATSIQQEQLDVFELGLSNLMLITNTRIITCPPKRGIRELAIKNHLTGLDEFFR